MYYVYCVIYYYWLRNYDNNVMIIRIEMWRKKHAFLANNVLSHLLQSFHSVDGDIGYHY